jgi:phosphoribosylaminoimidazole-succinocarboxamide synthase
MRTIGRLSSKINAILKSFFERRGLLLMGFRVEFGKQAELIYVGDEISLDTCQFWDKKSNCRLEVAHAGQDPVESEKAYRDLYSRLTNSS